MPVNPSFPCVKILFSHFLEMMLCNNKVCLFWLEGPSKMSTVCFYLNSLTCCRNDKKAKLPFAARLGSHVTLLFSNYSNSSRCFCQFLVSLAAYYFLIKSCRSPTRLAQKANEPKATQVLKTNFHLSSIIGYLSLIVPISSRPTGRRRKIRQRRGARSAPPRVPNTTDGFLIRIRRRRRRLPLRRQ
jgi:hypothetical protein